MTPPRGAAVIAWLAGVAACVVVVARTEFSADLSAFLPRSPSPEQRVLVEQLREGVVSRLILVGFEGATTATTPWWRPTATSCGATVICSAPA